ncbi:MAG: hypothetical protein AAFX08_08215 [Pseudomonadota bacterium]
MTEYAVQGRTVGLKDEINLLVQWTVATPILATWFLASMLPVFGLFDANRTAVTMSLDILFFAIGFYPLLGAFIGSRLVAHNLASRDTIGEATHGAGLTLAAYAFFWLTAYSIYRYLI